MVVRSFIAVECEEQSIISGLVQAQGSLKETGARLKLVESENIHMTLRFLGNIEDHQVDSVSEMIKETSFEPFTANIKGIGVFPNLRRPATIWAGLSTGNEEMAELFSVVNEGLEELGFERERRRFHPHLTIARVRGGQNREQLVERLITLENTEFGEYTVDKVYLKKSVLTRSGPIYSNLAESG